ncbi:asparagine synthase (glutamine-hydrolyzing) [Archaeoglobus veneficus]|uniref:Putative asparagine synthetase [glutamine-hydrolyzing] n=1 Tax=Archaeoglobus veneficus (strain DSM 11195 / SNP6) TaxID=693661 RepID=F2KNC7_ARCVS|nr:asparagine synthase (glutamine-hydrolyzing) [Archaeoglobus veneficus]AEA47329.1 asparagine synthase (glutamine-hydrolyzing) [Archaeoglobus veneficus SNP6]
MCGIAGIISRDGSSVSDQIVRMLGRMHHRGPDGCGVVVGKTIQRSFSLEDIDIKGIEGSMAMGHVRLAIVGGMFGQQPLEDCQRKLILLHNGEIYNYRELRKRLEADHRFITETDSETIVHLIEQFYNGDLASSVAKALGYLDGVYAIAVSDGREVVIARDRIGVKQLYIGVNERYVAFASERKALWEIGICNEIRLPPGHLAKLSRDGVTLRKVLELPVNLKTSIYDFHEAIEKYHDALIEAVRKRVSGLEKVGVIFSGGIDSVLIAKIASEFTDVTCYTAGLKGSEDIKYAKLAASEIGLEIRVKELSLEDVEAYIPEVMETIEDRLFGQVEVAIPVYAAVEMAHEDCLKVMLTGQGADELFGGYPWYGVIVERDGYRVLEQYMVSDILNLYRETLEREDKITMAHSIELRVPYLDPQVIKVAMQIDAKLKITSPKDRLGKFIHRELAKRIGVSADLAERPKEAAQHGSGVHEAILEIARINGFNEEVARIAGYNLDESVREKLGSSIRYGYKYGGKKLWTVPDYVQMYLDTIALEQKLVCKSELEHLKEVLCNI